MDTKKQRDTAQRFSRPMRRICLAGLGGEGGGLAPGIRKVHGFGGLGLGGLGEGCWLRVFVRGVPKISGVTGCTITKQKHSLF